MSNINSKNLENCNSCSYCSYCNFCYYCYSCNFCYYCYSCNSCYYCYFCYSCDFCYYCDSCNSCNSCYSCDSCYGSYGLRMSERMIFCLGDGKYETKGEGYQKNNRIFNVQVTKDEWDTAKKTLPELKIGLTKWIDKKDMTPQEKRDKPGWVTMGGYLKRFGYKETWATWWAENLDSHQTIFDLPHFDASIFTGITGIELKNLESGLISKEVIIDGTVYVPKKGQ